MTISKWILVVAGLAAIPLGSSAPALAQNDGFIYGTITMGSGTTYTGTMRWGDEESFWDDLFDSLKEDRPFLDDLDDMIDDDRKRGRSRIRILGREISWGDDDDWSGSRVFTARFGDIESIEVTGDEDADIRMKSGETFAVSGYANDVGGTILVRDDSLGNVELKWNRVEHIEFKSTPSQVDVPAYRLHGRVSTDAGDFEGYIQWDSEECLSTDELDGESEDGNMSIEMGRIRSIERRGRRGSIVELKDGRKLRMRGTNDVNHEIRGILVEDERFGRVKVGWDEFDRAEFDDEGASGRAYDDFGEGYRLEGTVEARDGETFEGLIVFDLDESESWEMLNGSWDGVEYYIPFDMISSIEPRGRDESEVKLKTGETVFLEDGQDVSDRNDGVLVYGGDDDPEFVRWDDVERIEFHR